MLRGRWKEHVVGLFAMHGLIMKCVRCKSSNVRRSSWKRSEKETSHFLFSPYRCKECGHRFFKLSGGFKGLLATGLGLFAFASFVVGMYVWSQNAQSNVPIQAVQEVETAKLVLDRAKKGDTPSQYELGLMYLRGDAIPQDYNEALKWLEVAARKGHSGAQLNLGLLYKTGRGTLQDYAAAAKWFELAAQQGNPQAQYQAGTLYKTGQGVKHDLRQAYIWYNIAASRGYEPAIAARDSMAAFMSGQEVAEAQSQSKNWKPAAPSLVPPAQTAQSDKPAAQTSKPQ
jgi:uncharacterized protein